MKKLISLLCAAVIVMSGFMCANVVQYTASAESSDRPENLFASKGDWDPTTDVNGAVVWEDNELVITPIYVVGSTYLDAKMGQGKISFTYQLEYADGVPPFTPETPEYQCFFGVTFLNAPANVTNPSGNSLAIPFGGAVGGYPYMVAFDGETQGDSGVRATQLGLTLRRYNFNGSHDYTRWSSVNPTEETFYNDAGVPYQSKIPDQYEPVTMEDCFDAEEHTVDIQVTNLYKEKGDDVDAVKIEVWFDGVLSLTVIDEMPFEGEDLGEVVDVDKREKDGYISLYAYNNFNQTDITYWDYKIHVKSFSAVFGESNESGGNGQTTKDGGCSGSVGFVASGVAVLMVVATAAVIGARKQRDW